MKIKELKKHYKTEIKIEKKLYRKGKRERRLEHRKRLDELHNQYIEDYGKRVAERGKRLPINPPKRAILEEIGNAVSHGVGSVLSVIGLILMLIYSDTAAETASAAIYFSGLFIMFTMSCLYHSFPHGSKVKRIFRRFDYSCIYLLIGSTFAPILLSFIGGVFGLVFFIIQWVIIITGITLVSVFGPERLKFLNTPMYIILGWCAILLLPKMFGEDIRLALFILGGGVVYSVGIIPFAMKSRVAHFIWHLFVMAGAALQWVGIFLSIYLPVH